MGLNVYGKITPEIEKKITDRLVRAGFVIEDGGWKNTLEYLRACEDSEKYRKGMSVAARCCGMKPTMRFSWGWGHFGTSDKN
jgi:hypothetical protein